MNNCRAKFYVRSPQYTKAMLLYKMCAVVLIFSGVGSVILESLKLGKIANITELCLVLSVLGVLLFGMMRYKMIEMRYIANDDIIKVIDNKKVSIIGVIKYSNAILIVEDTKYIVYDEEDESKLLTFKEQVKNIRGYDDEEEDNTEERDLEDDSEM